MAADALAVGDDFESWTGIGSLHLQGDPPGRWCDRQAAASSLVGRVPCYLTPACSAPTRNSRASAASRNVRPVAVLLAVVTGCPVIRFVLLPERFVLLPERFGIQLPGVLRSPPSRLRKVTAPKALQRRGRFLVQFLGAAVRFKLTRLRFGSALPCSRHPVRLVQCRCPPHRSWRSSLRQPPQDEQG